MNYIQCDVQREYNNTLNQIASLVDSFCETEKENKHLSGHIEDLQMEVSKLEQENKELKDTLNEHTKLEIEQAQRIETLENIVRRCGYDPRD
jgi:septal ring factor EnvC (AmiA/AmiB activator)